LFFSGGKGVGGVCVAAVVLFERMPLFCWNQTYNFSSRSRFALIALSTFFVSRHLHNLLRFPRTPSQGEVFSKKC
jgi:hypothetical protein